MVRWLSVPSRIQIETDATTSALSVFHSSISGKSSTENRCGEHAVTRSAMKPFLITDTIEVRNNAPFFFIGGPCVIESFEHIDFLCGKISQICKSLNVPFIFKASFDKANRSSIKSFRGPG